MMISALALAAAVSAQCEWASPRGTRRLIVPPASLVDSYTQIPADVRAKLKARISRLQYDDVAEITRDGIKGQYKYSDLRWMYFGHGERCNVVTMKTWTAADVERALMFTEVADGVTYTLGLPTVCANLSLFTRGARIAPPPPRRDDKRDDVVIDPIPAIYVVPFPDVEPGSLADDYHPQTFSRMSRPTDAPERDRITVDQPWIYWSTWRPLPGRVTVEIQQPEPIVVDLKPVPGVVPVYPEKPEKVIEIPDRGIDAVQAVPEPGTWALMLVGLLGVWLMTRRRNGAV